MKQRGERKERRGGKKKYHHMFVSHTCFFSFYKSLHGAAYSSFTSHYCEEHFFASLLAHALYVCKSNGKSCDASIKLSPYRTCLPLCWWEDEIKFQLTRGRRTRSEETKGERREREQLIIIACAIVFTRVHWWQMLSIATVFTSPLSFYFLSPFFSFFLFLLFLPVVSLIVECALINDWLVYTIIRFYSLSIRRVH